MDDAHMVSLVLLASAGAVSSAKGFIKGIGGKMKTTIRISDQDGVQCDLFLPEEEGVQIPSIGDDIIYVNGTGRVQHRSLQYDKVDDGSTRLYVVLKVFLPKEPAHNIKVRFP